MSPFPRRSYLIGERTLRTAGWLLLAAGLAASVAAWQLAADSLANRAEQDFESFAALAAQRVEEQAARQIDLLAGFQGLLRASPAGGETLLAEHRREWNLDARFPALQSLRIAPAPAGAEVLEASERALRRGSPAGTLVATPGNGPAWAVVVPVAAGGGQGPEAPVLIATVNAQTLLADAARGGPQAGHRLWVVDAGWADGSAPAATSDATVGGPADAGGGMLFDSGRGAALPDLQALPPQHHQANYFTVAGRMWLVNATREPRDFRLDAVPLLLLGGGTLLTLTLCGVLGVLSGGYRRARRLAAAMSGRSRDNAKQLEAIIDGSADAIVVFDASGRVVDVNPAACRMFDERELVLRDRPARRLVVHPRSLLPGLVALARSTDSSTGPRSLRVEALGRRRNGEQFPLELALAAVSVSRVTRYVAIVRDVSEREALERARAEAEERLRQADALRRTVFELSPAALLAFDPHGIVVAANPAAQHMLQLTQDDPLEELQLSDYIEAPDLLALAKLTGLARGEDSVTAMLAALAGGGANRQWPCAVRRPDGDTLRVLFSVRAIAEQDAAPNGYVLIALDVTERSRMEDRIHHMAHHDALTGLPNRSLLEDRLDRALRAAVRDQLQLALLFVDLDRFKTINDSLGHHAGDRLLCQVAERLSQCVRGSDTVARLGGDEFVVLLPRVQEAQDAEQVAGKIREDMQRPFEVDGQELRITPSIGVVTFPEGGRDVDTLLRHADAAMYCAKAAGRNSVRSYSAAPAVIDDARVLRMESDLHRALERDELRLALQPQFAAATGALVGAEALLRWDRGGQGLVSPADFIPLAEESGLIVTLGDWVLQEACRQAAQWVHHGAPALKVAVNLSPRQMQDDRLTARVAEALAKSGLPASRLELEITEGAVVRELQGAARILAELAGHGTRIAVDDFGVGFSSLSYLQALPVHRLKIDRSFLRHYAKDGDDGRLIGAIISLAHSMNLMVTAEGVENAAQLRFLTEQRCDEIQGFLLGRPVPPEGFVDLLRCLHPGPQPSRAPH